MNLRQIEVFHAIMVTGSVSDAARLLHVSVPAVSRVLSHTESRLGFMLFERVKGHLHPTAEAKALFNEVDHIADSVKRVKQLTRALAARRYEMVSVVCSPSIGQMLVPLAIAHFRERHPEVRVQFQCLNHAYLQEKILNGHVDIGISTLPMNHPALQTHPIARGRLICVCPPRHRLAAQSEISISDLRGETLISYPSDTPFGAMVEQIFADYEEQLQTAIEVGSPQNACALARAGAGIALIDEFSLQHWPLDDFVVIPVQNSNPIVADLVHLKVKSLTPSAEALVQSLHGILRQHGLAHTGDT